ncbi:hypothetical protein BDV93DRAFT_547657 [Ceratobasidium sp. AG-I]|nr:hypothetical protein BDV93DRAFT_547657 [Ceratobasidium sp. AG-I]
MFGSLAELECANGHRHPQNGRFIAGTTAGLVIVLPFLIIINIVTLGYELVPSFQPNFNENNTFPAWWGTTPLPKLLNIETPPCEPQSLGRGDTFRVTASLFDYTIMSAWNTSKDTSASRVHNQQRIMYQGESFANCSANTAQFDHNLVEDTHTITVGVTCQGTPEYPVYLAMETKMVFAWLLSKDFVGQYYGPGVNLLDVSDTDSNNYRTLAFAVLEAISTDSLTIMRGNHLSNPALSISSFYNISFDNGIINTTPVSNSLMYANGTYASPTWPAEATIYEVSIYNLVNVAVHTVNLDLGSAGPESIYRNREALNKTIGPNLAPVGTAPANWAQESLSFYYGRIPRPYQTWAQAIRAGQTIELGNVTGIPDQSSKVTAYLCSSYQLKTPGSLAVSLLVGLWTMLQSGRELFAILLIAYVKRFPRGCVHCDNPVPEPRSLPIEQEEEATNEKKQRPRLSVYGSSILERLPYRRSSTMSVT